MAVMQLRPGDPAWEFFRVMENGTGDELRAAEAADYSGVEGGPVGYRTVGDKVYLRHGPWPATMDLSAAPACVLMWGDRRLFH